MATPFWEPGTLYQPGAIVRPISAPVVTVTAPENPNLELGAVGWTFSDPDITIVNSGPVFNGTWAIVWADDLYGTHSFVNDRIVPVRAGQTINAQCRHRRGTDNWQEQGSLIGIQWLDSGYAPVSVTKGTLREGGDNGPWYVLSVSAVAPPGAVFAQIYVEGYNNNDGGSHTLRWDAFTWDYTFQGIPDGLVFKAVQAAAGVSGTTEPTWPTVNGQQVVDNEVTWEAAFATRVTWEATPVLVSGATEPDWPTAFDGTVEDGTIAWRAMDHRVKDPKCPNSKVVAIAASKIFAIDDDIVPFSATVNPLDWSTPQDAGYLPFGLQTYGATPATALGLYRGNLVVFNAEGYQMWQVDEDPANMALLDASPIDCPYPKSVQPVSNDLVVLTSLGLRNIGIAGASTNIQAGFFGKQIDPLVLAAIRRVTEDTEPHGLFWPGAGQYWIFFNNEETEICEVFVLTMNGGAKDMSWSRYEFPAMITDWAILGTNLYLRTATGLVWRVDEDALFDDIVCTSPSVDLTATFTSASNFPNYGYIEGVQGTLIESDMAGPTFAGFYSVDSNSVYVGLEGTGAPPAEDFLAEYSLAVFNSGDLEIASGSFVGAPSSVDGNIRWWEVDIGLNNLLAEYNGQDVRIVLSGPGGEEECTGEDFEGRIWWPYLDFGQLGREKQLEGFDLVCTGEVDVVFGYDQSNPALATPAYTLQGDTLPGTMVPMPITGPSFQFRLNFAPGQAWEWNAASLYLTDWSRQ